MRQSSLVISPSTDCASLSPSPISEWQPRNQFPE
jgi:hypothetical protein